MMPRHRSRWLWLAALCLLAVMQVHAASQITITSARTQVVNDMLMVDADATFDFSEDAIAALNSGIPLIIELDVRISRPRSYWWDARIFSTRRRYAIERHALSDQFVLSDLITDERRVHGTLERAIEDLGRIRALPVVEVAELDGAADCEVSLRLQLDIESLPGPLIPLAYLSPGWHMSSGWYRWRIGP